MVMEVRHEKKEQRSMRGTDRKIAPFLIRDLKPDPNPPEELLRLSTYFKEYLCWGKVELVIKNGKPVFVTHVCRDVKLTAD